MKDKLASNDRGKCLVNWLVIICVCLLMVTRDGGVSQPFQWSAHNQVICWRESSKWANPSNEKFYKPKNLDISLIIQVKFLIFCVSIPQKEVSYLILFWMVSIKVTHLIFHLFTYQMQLSFFRCPLTRIYIKHSMLDLK